MTPEELRAEEVSMVHALIRKVTPLLASGVGLDEFRVTARAGTTWIPLSWRDWRRHGGGLYIVNESWLLTDVAGTLYELQDGWFSSHLEPWVGTPGKQVAPVTVLERVTAFTKQLDRARERARERMAQRIDALERARDLALGD